MTSDPTELSEPSALEPQRRRPGCPHRARAQVPGSLGSVQASGVWLWKVREAQARGRTSPSLRGTGISASRTQSLRRRPSSAVSSRLVRTPPAPPAAAPAGSSSPVPGTASCPRSHRGARAGGQRGRDRAQMQGWPGRLSRSVEGPSSGRVPPAGCTDLQSSVSRSGSAVRPRGRRLGCLRPRCPAPFPTGKSRLPGGALGNLGTRAPRASHPQYSVPTRKGHSSEEPPGRPLGPGQGAHEEAPDFWSSRCSHEQVPRGSVFSSTMWGTRACGSSLP